MLPPCSGPRRLAEVELREQMKQAGGKWNRSRKVCELRYEHVVVLKLEARIVMDGRSNIQAPVVLWHLHFSSMSCSSPGGRLDVVSSLRSQHMSVETQEILDRALKLSTIEKARLVDALLSSLDKPDEAIDALWRKEVEDRIMAFDIGHLRAVSLEQVLAKYHK
jgi:putative addiction module component (TIGR02574 family)